MSALSTHACIERSFLANLLNAADAEGLSELDVIAQVGKSV